MKLMLNNSSMSIAANTSLTSFAGGKQKRSLIEAALFVFCGLRRL